MKNTLVQKNIPSGWQKIKLGDCLLQKPDYGINAASTKFSTSLPAYLRITDISEDGKFLSVKKTSVNHQNSKNYILDEGDLVLARTGASVGKTYLYNKNDGQLVFAGFLIRMKPDKTKLNPGFLSAYTRTKKYFQWVKEISTRSGQPGVNSVEYSSLSLLLPPLPEQNRIVSILETWDKAIEKLTKKIEIKKQIKKGLMQDLLVGKKRLGGFTDKWETVSLGGVSTFVNGYTFKSSTYNNSGIYKVITIANVQDGYMFIGGPKLVNELPSNIDEEQILKKGDILISMTGNVGRVCRVSHDNCLLNQRVGKIVAKTINEELLYLFLHDRRFLGQMIASAQGGAQGNLSTGDIKEYSFDIPKSKKEQAEIANILITLDKGIKKLERKLFIIKDQKKYLLNNLITGNIRTPENLNTYQLER